MQEAADKRRRDPSRKERILAVAAELIATQGFHAVGMSAIGSAAGITGSAIYRHFDSKSAVLVALFDNVIDRRLASAEAVAEQTADDREVLAQLMSDQVCFSLTNRKLMHIYLREIHNLPEEDRRRLRRKQRRYLEEWVHPVLELRPDLNDAQAWALVHACIGAVQSVLYHNSGLPLTELGSLMMAAAKGLLGIDGLPDVELDLDKYTVHPDLAS
ncbi:TetR/AcrR family transcriptional regulator [Pseudonocardia dioxanivorans]|jgi:AcrR family transcriptional regulator|uniref:TetR/AcrR family transcriptional regulator n=1 Tax=Pseudonocardia dioxanivorans TaxID=240495 RepID=UPI000CD17A0F|nr:TetR/AcrR family transcriptional regulator [Pseudonocardia dioxanivorans]